MVSVPALISNDRHFLSQTFLCDFTIRLSTSIFANLYPALNCLEFLLHIQQLGTLHFSFKLVVVNQGTVGLGQLHERRVLRHLTVRQLLTQLVPIVQHIRLRILEQRPQHGVLIISDEDLLPVRPGHRVERLGR